MSVFDTATEIIKPREGISFKIEHFDLGQQQISRERIRDSINGTYETCGIKPGKYVRLRSGYDIIMSNTPMERNTNSEFMRYANGRVLIGGLGLGLVLMEILKKPEVTHVEVVEKYSEIIELVWDQIPNENNKAVCHKGDILEWWPDDKRKWDTIYFDIWTYICTDNLEDMKKLHRRFGRRLNRENPRAWMGSWRRSEIEYLKRKEDRERRRFSW